MNTSHRPTWQLPPGVSRGGWDYVNSREIATEYDAYHGDHPLLQFDQQWIAHRLDRRGSTDSQPSVLLDLGCGTGRALLPWSRRGWRTIGIDLSLDMLDEAQKKNAGSDEPPALIHSNLAELDWMADDFADAAVCLYSSIGMIRGERHRDAMLSAVFRALKEGGLFFVHAHNRGSWLRDPGGLRTIGRSYLRSWTDPDYEYGDRIYAYRGLPSMFLHIFSKSELSRSLRKAGFAIESILLLNRTSSQPLKHRWWLPSLRAGGFLVTAAKTSRE